ncbi:MAG: hypothetical protein FJZ58_08340, partial [Chlamydiae bacterium]|nr:hypothetical protein [Chlamydiota bacterium]
LRKAFIEHLPPSQVIHLSSKEPNKTPYFLNELEKHYRYLLYETDPELSDWTRLSLRQADLVLFIGFAQSSPSLNEIEQFFFQNIKKHTQTVKLILLHEHSSTVPIHTESWTQLRSHLLHEHIRLSSSADLIKLIRSITYQSIGLVLSGGGARGLAHIGVLKALEELKIPIDCIGGSSMGALIAGAYASGMDINTMIKEVEDTLLPAIRSLDYTFPLLALKSGKSISLALRKTFGTERNIQDCWTRFFCVSTNLSKFHLQVHHQGILWESIRASLSIPALFPPVTTSKGELLVDGGLVNNMPVDIMKQQIQEGIVLAISTNSRKDPISSPPLEMWVSGWKLLLKKLSSMNSSPSTPHLGELMMEIILLSGSEHQMRMQEEADHCLHLELSSFNLLQFKAFEKIIDIGYQEAIKYFSFLSFPLSK